MLKPHQRCATGRGHVPKPVHPFVQLGVKGLPIAHRDPLRPADSSLSYPRPPSQPRVRAAGSRSQTTSPIPIEHNSHSIMLSLSPKSALRPCNPTPSHAMNPTLTPYNLTASHATTPEKLYGSRLLKVLAYHCNSPFFSRREKRKGRDARNPDLCEISSVLAKVSNPLVIHRPLSTSGYCAQCLREGLARPIAPAKPKNGKNKVGEYNLKARNHVP